MRAALTAYVGPISRRKKINLSSAQSSPSGVHFREVIAREISLDRSVLGMTHHLRSQIILFFSSRVVYPVMGTIMMTVLQNTDLGKASGSGPELVTDGLILREDHPPASAHQSLKPFQKVRGVATGDPTGLEQWELFTHQLQRHFHKQKAVVPPDPLDGGLTAALPDAEHQLQSQGAAIIPWIGGLSESFRN